MVRSFEAAWTNLGLKECGVCGELETVSQDQRPLWKAIPLSRDASGSLQGPAAALRLGAAGATTSAVANVARVGDDVFSVNPAKVCSDGGASVEACPRCLASLESSKVPWNAFQRFDLGRPLADLTLPELTPAEKASISMYVHFNKLVQIRFDTGFHTKFKSHTISMPFEGPTVLAPQIPSLSHNRFALIFVGQKTKEIMTKKGEPVARTVFETLVRCNPQALSRWLRFLKEHNFMYENIDIDERRLAEFESEGRLLFEQADVMDDRVAVAASHAHDIADAAKPDLPDAEEVLLQQPSWEKPKSMEAVRAVIETRRRHSPDA
eukprot:TRINITY_DN14672_c0_g1_i2.p1 TRINITY_DN14672_c0_g1~~TRINITY_DN14672_c0_g1_i2.p1  ORF type:complete len:322 (+),score=78.25 TRINITY_DN14672_c0_g1_i2:254-1219(+)